MLLLPASTLHPQRPPQPKDSSTRLPEVSILGTAEQRKWIPGAVHFLDASALARSRVLSTNEALRKVSGIVVRDEEGLGLRPNIGIRGLNPTRSTKTLLLEDGVPITLAPYGDNAAYYHPPVTRMAGIEVVKGAGQILYGPQTVGGVINYITPGLPSRSGGSARVAGGSNDFANAQVRTASVNGASGVLLDVGRWRGIGARRNTRSDVTDASLKLVLPLRGQQRVIAKANAYREGSQVTYSGLTEREWSVDPRQNPFRNDRFDITRVAGSVAHEWSAGPRKLVTTAYAHDISRDWWRQSSNSAQRPNTASNPACGGMANLETGCGNEGRLRRYQVVGVEPRLTQPLLLGSLAGSLDVGARLHREKQMRRQENGPTFDARSGTLLEDNLRETAAVATFAQARVGTDRWSVTPGLRVEHIVLTRRNFLPVAGSPAGVGGRTALTELIPGLGATLAANNALHFFAGVHRGFAPPRNEDVISNSTGGVVDLAAERSWNTELGARWRGGPQWTVDATLFQMDFSNQIIPASVAGGTGATLTSAGRTHHRGVELDLRGELPASLGLVPFVSLAATWLPTARYVGPRYVYLGADGGDVVGKVYAEPSMRAARTRVSVTGNRLPYAPEAFLTASLGVRRGDGFDLAVEAVHQGEQFADPTNRRVTVPDGQQGSIPATTLWNATLNWRPPLPGFTLFASVKNVADALVIVDRTRGLLPGMGRVVLLGAERRF
ncbi:MAG: TonB-dependent receptor [Gemmatimonadaceae bacterium]|nr:TonB-dependent receptor [Gemmatimonadaceae bacterium]